MPIGTTTCCIAFGIVEGPVFCAKSCPHGFWRSFIHRYIAKSEWRGLPAYTASSLRIFSTLFAPQKRLAIHSNCALQRQPTSRGGGMRKPIRCYERDKRYFVQGSQQHWNPKTTATAVQLSKTARCSSSLVYGFRKNKWGLDGLNLQRQSHHTTMCTHNSNTPQNNQGTCH